MRAPNEMRRRQCPRRIRYVQSHLRSDSAAMITCLRRRLDELVGVGFDRSILAFLTSGEDWLNTSSTACAPFGSIRPVVEYIGIVFFSAAR